MVIRGWGVVTRSGRVVVTRGGREVVTRGGRVVVTRGGREVVSRGLLVLSGSLTRGRGVVLEVFLNSL